MVAMGTKQVLQSFDSLVGRAVSVAYQPCYTDLGGCGQSPHPGYPTREAWGRSRGRWKGDQHNVHSGVLLTVHLITVSVPRSCCPTNYLEAGNIIVVSSKTGFYELNLVYFGKGT